MYLSSHLCICHVDHYSASRVSRLEFAYKKLGCASAWERSNRSYRTYVECAMRIARNGMQYWRGELENCPTARLQFRNCSISFPRLAPSCRCCCCCCCCIRRIRPEGPVYLFLLNTRLPFPWYAIMDSNPRLFRSPCLAQKRESNFMKKPFTMLEGTRHFFSYLPLPTFIFSPQFHDLYNNIHNDLMSNEWFSMTLNKSLRNL